MTVQSNPNLKTIVGSIPTAVIPASVRPAIEFEKAAQTFLESIQASQQVDLATATTPGDIVAVHAAALNVSISGEKSLALALELAAIAGERLEAAWGPAIAETEPLFSDAFDKAAASLYTQLEKLADASFSYTQHWTAEGSKLRLTVEELTRLANVRDAYALLAGRLEGTVSAQYEQVSRTATFDNPATATQFLYNVRVRKENYWIVLAQTPNARIIWQTRAQQMSQPAALAVIARDDALAARGY